MNCYAHEKIRELESQRLKALAGRPRLERADRGRVFGPMASAAGRSLRRLGVGLEAWGNPCIPEAERHFRFDGR